MASFTTPLPDPFAQTAGTQPAQQQTPTQTGIASQAAPAGGNPFTDVLNHTATWNNALQSNALGDKTLHPDPGGSTGGTGGTGGTPATTGTTDLAGNPTNSLDPNAGGFDVFNTQGSPTFVGSGLPGGVDAGTWADAQRYTQAAQAQGGDWSALLKNPGWVTEFRNWALSHPGGTNVRIEDYLQAMHPELKGMAPQGGVDSYAAWQQQNKGLQIGSGEHAGDTNNTPNGVDPGTWADAQRYAQTAKGMGGNWDALLQHPEWVTEFRNWALGTPGGTGVNIWDYLEAKHPELQGLRGSQNNTDSYAAWQQAHPDLVATQGQPQQPDIPAPMHYNPKTGMYEPIAPPPGQQWNPQTGQWEPTPTTNTSPAGPPTAPPNTPPTGPTATPPPGGPPGGPPATPPPPTAGTPPSAPTTPGTQTGAPPDETQSLIDTFNKNFSGTQGPDIESMLDPMFARQREKLAQQMQAEAALTPGRLQSGGFGQNEGQALADLSGQQSGQLGQALQQQNLAKMQQNTQLMQLATSAGMQKYVADLNADTTRFGVTTNADLQRYLDSQDNVLKKYGIDTQDVLQRYQADLNLKGVKYSADANVSAASLHAAAAQAAAGAAAEASRQNAQLQFQLGTAQLGVEREKNIGNFVLGLLGMGNVDINTLNGILAGTPLGTTVVKP